MRFLCPLLLIFFMSCKDFVGNPHKNALPPRIVSVRKDNLKVEPAIWWTGIKSNQVEIVFRGAGLAAYEVRLEQPRGLKIKKVDKSGGLDMIRITLEIKESAPVQNAEWVFSKGKNTFTQEYPIRIKGIKH